MASGAYPASCPWDTYALGWTHCCRGLQPVTHFCLVSILRIARAIPSPHFTYLYGAHRLLYCTFTKGFVIINLVFIFTIRQTQLHKHKNILYLVVIRYYYMFRLSKSAIIRWGFISPKQLNGRGFQISHHQVGL